MFRRRRSENYHHHRNSQRFGMFNFLRKPAFQIGLVIAAALVVLLLAAIGQQQPAANLPPEASTIVDRPMLTATNLPEEIDVSSAYALYKSNAVYFLDVRDRQGWDAMHIPSTTLLPLIQVSALASKMPKDKPIIVVSDSDSSSLQARDILRKAGILNVSSMSNGISEWKLQGFPIEP